MPSFGGDMVSVFLWKRRGAFSAPTRHGFWSGQASLPSAFHRDGRLDLAAANQNDGSVSVFLAPEWAFGPALDLRGRRGKDAVVAGDFLGQGSLDLAVANFGGSSVTLLANDGTGHFRAASTVAVGRQSVLHRAGDQ